MRSASEDDTIGHAAQGELTQREQIGFAEEAVDSSGDLLRHVHLAGLEAPDEIVGRQVDQLDLVRLVEDAIGDRFALAHAGDLRDQVVETLQVLNVHGRPDADALLEQLLDVLPALGMARRRIAFDEIGMRELVDNEDRGMAPQARVQVELAPHRAAVVDCERRQLLQALHQALGLDAAMRLDVADDDVAAAADRVRTTRVGEIVAELSE